MEDLRVRIARVTFVGLSLVMMASACSFSIGAPQSSTSSKSTSPSSNPNPASASSPASSPGGSAAQVTNVRLAKDFTYGDVVNPTSNFYPSDRQFHLVVDLGNPSDGTTVAGAWYAIDAGSHRNEKLDSQTYTLKNGEDRVHFTLTNQDNWPKGKYKVDVMVNGKLTRTLDFRVQQ
jgi:hypothetical protein